MGVGTHGALTLVGHDTTWPSKFNTNGNFLDPMIAGGAPFRVYANEALAVGDSVYVLGRYAAGTYPTVTVGKADADLQSHMPAVGVIETAISINGEGWARGHGIAILGSIAFPAGSILVVGTDGQITWSGQGNEPASGDYKQILGVGMTTGYAWLDVDLRLEQVP